MLWGCSAKHLHCKEEDGGDAGMLGSSHLGHCITAAHPGALDSLLWAGSSALSVLWVCAFILPSGVVEADTDQWERACDTLLMCIVTVLNHGLRNGGGVGDILRKPSKDVSGVPSFCHYRAALLPWKSLPALSSHCHSSVLSPSHPCDCSSPCTLSLQSLQ